MVLPSFAARTIPRWTPQPSDVDSVGAIVPVCLGVGAALATLGEGA